MENTNKTEKIHKILIGFFVAMVIIAAPIVFFAATFQSHISLEAGTEFKQEMLWKTPVVPKAIINEDVKLSFSSNASLFLLNKRPSCHQEES